jgi:hypothetical protein
MVVREYVQAIHEGEQPELEEMVVTRDHFEEPLETVDPTEVASASLAARRL